MSNAVNPDWLNVSVAQPPAPNIAMSPAWKRASRSLIGAGDAAILSTYTRSCRKETAVSTGSESTVGAHLSSVTRLPPWLTTHGRMPGKISLLVHEKPYFSGVPSPFASTVSALAAAEKSSHVQSGWGGSRPASANRSVL